MTGDAVTIVVAVKNVPVGGAFLRIEADRLTRDGVSHGIDPINEVAVEWAVQQREAGVASRVVVASLGPASAADALRRALAMGADEAVLVTDPELAGADVRTTARALAAVVGQLDASVLVTGYESLDGSSGAVPAATAATLGWGLVSRMGDGQLRDGILHGTRDLGEGPATVEVDLPVVVSVVEGHVAPRFPKLKDVMRTRNAQPQTFDGASLGVARAAGGERVTALREVPMPRREPTILDLEAGVDALVRALTNGSGAAPSDQERANA